MKTLKTVTATRFTENVLTVGVTAFQGTGVRCGNGAPTGGMSTYATSIHTNQVSPAWTTTDQQIPAPRTSAANDVSVPHPRGSTA